ncbi:MAG: tripartite tricarboxylate transporter substrate binding protein, partial [Sulfuricaulis sp.]|nr:tripartite tricarboxylate transporter substrate binding protein [Sulfuricaulis sp.]
AKDYPSKPIRLVVPFAPGGPMDFIGRVLGQKIARVTGQNLFIDNRAGAGGVIGTDVVAKSLPDGYTILHTSSGHATLPSILKSLPYDPVKDFTPITLVANSTGLVLVVHPSVPARSVREFIALAKSHPGKLNYGSVGPGSAVHFATEAFNMMAGTQLTNVSYKGVAPVVVELIGGHIDIAIITGTTVLPHIRSGKLRALGITAPVRWSELPEAPTIDEAGLKGYKYVVWYGLWFPAGAPAEYVTRIRAEVVKAFEDPETKRTFVDQGFIPIGSAPQEFTKTILEEIEFHRRLAAQIGLTPQ